MKVSFYGGEVVDIDFMNGLVEEICNKTVAPVPAKTDVVEQVIEIIEDYFKRYEKNKHGICVSCRNNGCILQSGIRRESCDFYID